MTEAEYAERTKRLAGWIAPKTPKAVAAKRVVRKLDMAAPVDPLKVERKRSAGEEAMEMALQAANAPSWVCEYRFDPERRWRADFGFLEARLLVEVEGGQWIKKGRHQTGTGWAADMEKYNAMTLQGWRLLRFTTEMVEDGRALGYIMRALA